MLMCIMESLLGAGGKSVMVHAASTAVMNPVVWGFPVDGVLVDG